MGKKAGGMDENNLQTPVVIQVASHEEQKDQNLYNIDFENLESPKEYVIDQIFCGENLAVYALFEISDLSGNKSDKNLIEVPESSTNEEFRFYHRSSYKKSIEENEFNGFKSNYNNFNTDEAERLPTKDTGQESESFYCVKNYGGQCEVTRAVDDRSNLKVLYSKNQNVGKFKLVSRGVNTDIAQCPKLVDDVRKAISIGKPFAEGDGKTIEIQTFPPVKSSYELIEIETAPSSSSCNSDVDDFRKHNQKSSPNVLVVPLLMMDEGMLKTLKSDDKSQQIKKEKKSPSPEKVSFGINTDFSCLEFLSRSKDSDEDQESNFEQTPRTPSPSKDTQTRSKESKPDEGNGENNEAASESDLTTKKNILKEIKYLQDKLNILIKSLECGESKDSKPRILLEEKTPSVIQLAQQSRQPSVQQIESVTESKPVNRNQRRYDDRPILSAVSFSTPPTKPLTPEVRQKPSSVEREIPVDTLPIQAKSTISILTKSASSVFRVPFPWNKSNEKEDLMEELDVGQPYWTNFSKKNSKILRVSKSECSIQLTRLFTPDSKLDLTVGVKKALSFESGEDKIDSLGAKKTKFPSLKSDGNFKSKNNILSKNITPFNCEMGDEIGKKQKQDILLAQQTTTKDEGLLKVLEKEPCLTELKKPSQNDEEGDAKISFPTPPFPMPPLGFAPKNEKIVVNYCNTNGDRTLKPEKSFKKILGHPVIKSALSIDIEPKVSGQIDKPIVHNKNDKKLNTEANGKKDLKNNTLHKSKIPDKVSKNTKKETVQSDSVKHKPLALNRPRSSGQSKLHVDKLIKKVPASSNEITSGKAQPKFEKEEKLFGKNDQHHLPKTNVLKRERREVTQLRSESKDRETVPKPNETSDFVQNQTIHSNCSHPALQVKTEECHSQKHDSEDRTVPEDKPRIINLLTEPSPVESPSPNSPSVVVELFSKKQTSIADSHTDFDQDFATGPETDTSHVCLNEKNSVADPENSDGTLETGVKSVWALTKVLLYGDGTKKFEVLEVSLTPPECSLNNEKQNDLKNG